MRDMETSLVQAAKLLVVNITGLSKDALHIHLGLVAFLAMSWLCRRSPSRLVPLVAVVVIACLGELLDMRDDLATFGYWRWQASLHDVLNTCAWPALLTLWAIARRKGRVPGTS